MARLRTRSCPTSVREAVGNTGLPATVERGEGEGESDRVGTGGIAGRVGGGRAGTGGMTRRSPTTSEESTRVRACACREEGRTEARCQSYHCGAAPGCPSGAPFATTFSVRVKELMDAVEMTLASLPERARRLR